MKTTQVLAVNAFKAVDELMKMDFTFEDAWRLALLRKELVTTFDFQVAEERKIIERYGAVYNGSEFTFPDVEESEAIIKCQNFADDLDKLGQMPVSLNLPRVRIVMSKYPDLRIRPELIYNLMGFVTFVRDEDTPQLVE